MNVIEHLNSLGRRLAGQRPVTQPPESTVPRSFAPREPRVNLGARSMIALSLVLLVAACGGGSVGASSNPSGDGSGGGAAGGSSSDQPAVSATADEPGEAEGAGGLCAYLSPAAAGLALGEPVGDGVASSSSIAGSDMCRYTATGSDHNIQIERSVGKTRAAWDDSMTKTGMIEEDSVVALGEAAYRSSDAVFGPGTRLAVFDHGTAIWVVISTDADPATVFGAAETVARALLLSLAG